MFEELAEGPSVVAHASDSVSLADAGIDRPKRCSLALAAQFVILISGSLVLNMSDSCCVCRAAMWSFIDSKLNSVVLRPTA